MSQQDFNPFGSAFGGVAADNSLFFGSHHHSYHNQKNQRPSWSSGLRLKQETNKAYVYVVNTTGIKSECLQMTLDHQTDRKGTMMILHVGENGGGKEFQSHHGTRVHRLLLPSTVDADRITAFVTKNGVLTITAPKMTLQDHRDPPNSTYVQMTSLAATRA